MESRTVTVTSVNVLLACCGLLLIITHQCVSESTSICGDPHIVQHGTISNQTQSRTTYKCNDGYSGKFNYNRCISQTKKWTNVVKCELLSPDTLCGNPPKVNHGQPSNYSKTANGGAKLRYDCDPGYVHTGTRKANKCQLKDKSWTNNVRCTHNLTETGSTTRHPPSTMKPTTPSTQIGCSYIVTVQNAKLTKHSNGDRNYFPEGSGAELRCRQGYWTPKHLDSYAVTCTSAGTNYVWRGHGMALECRASECERLQAPANGNLEAPSRFKVKSWVTFSCNQGYELKGKQRLLCLVTKRWSGEAPSCVETESTTRHPPSTMKPTTPSTQIKRCEPLMTPENGVKNSTADTTGSSVSFTCNDGYELVGSKLLTCRSSGDWSGAEPICRVGECNSLPPLTNGHFNMTSGFEVKSWVNFFCDEGYEMKGTRRSLCLVDKTWTAEMPSCLHLCYKPKLADISVTPSKKYYDENEHIELTCLPGYTAESEVPVPLTCTSGGWSPEPVIKCKDTSCGNPPKVNHGNPSKYVITANGREAKLIYDCDTGYMHTGTRKANRCQLKDFTWTDNVRCTYNLTDGCSRVKVPTNTVIEDVPRVENAMYPAGTTANIRCDYNFVRNVRSPKSSVICAKIDGNRYEWHGEGNATDCVSGGQRSCDTETAPPGVTYNGIRFISSGLSKHNEIEIFKCHIEHFIAKGMNQDNADKPDENQVQCLNGQFTPSPRCEGTISCDRALNREGLTFGYSGWTTNGSREVFNCNNRYHVAIGIEDINTNFNYVSCINGRFQPKPKCIIKGCEPLTTPENGVKDSRDRTTGSSVSFTCTDGYELEGRERLTCRSSGDWSGKEPICRVKRCRELVTPENGVKDSRYHKTGSSVTFTCNDGYELVGDERLTCHNSGHWNGEEPICRVKRCRELVTPENGVKDSSDRTTGSSVSFTCNAGYELEGRERLTCHNSGHWNGEEPICRVISACKQVYTQELNTQKIGGLQYWRATSIEMCQVACNGDANCVSLDWDTTADPNNACWKHTDPNGKKASRHGVNHYAKEKCEGEVTTPNTMPTRQTGCDRSIKIAGITFSLTGYMSNGDTAWFLCDYRNQYPIGLYYANTSYYYRYVRCTNGRFEPTPKCQ